jgi:hypothetical protein
MVFPDGDAIIAHLKAIDTVLLIIDPFNQARTLDDGNNNVMIAKVARELNRIATAANVAALVLHHLRKGATGAPEDLMGALSLRATFRSCRILARMKEDQAKTLQVPERQAWRYSRIVGSKENYAPPPELTTWYKLESIDLNNPDALYTAGDNVQVAVSWTPPSAFAGISHTDLAAIFAKLRVPPTGM